MERFVIQIAIFGLSSFFILFISHELLNEIIETNEGHQFPKNTKALVLGNSHAEAAINDTLIAGMVNFSKKAEPYFYTLLKANEIVKNNSNLKEVFIHFRYNDITHERDAWFDQSNLYANYSYTMTSEERKLLFDLNPVGFFQIHLIRSIPRQVKVVLGMVLNKESREFGGHKVWPSRENTDFELPALNIHPINYIHLNHLLETIEIFKRKGIKVHLFQTPFFPGLEDNISDDYFSTYILSEYPEIKYLKFQEFSTEPNLFSDIHHLNKIGSVKFTEYFRNNLKEYIQIETSQNLPKKNTP